MTAMAEPASQFSQETLWETNLPWTCDLLQRSLPDLVRSVDPATQKSIFDTVLAERKSLFVEWSPDEMRASPRDLIRELVAIGVLEHNLIRKLRDEDLVHLFLAGCSHAGNMLAIRYLPTIRETVGIVVRAHGLCPFSDVDAFVEDITSIMALKLVTKLHTYRFKKPLEHWINSICKKAAISEARRETGRSKKGPRKYVSFLELMAKPVRTIKPEHRDLLQRIFEYHIKRGGKKSVLAIQLSCVEGLTAKEIAKRLGKTPGSVNQLISRDYARLREISMNEFGFTGTDI